MLFSRSSYLHCRPYKRREALKSDDGVIFIGIQAIAPKIANVMTSQTLTEDKSLIWNYKTLLCAYFELY